MAGWKRLQNARERVPLQHVINGGYNITYARSKCCVLHQGYGLLNSPSIVDGGDFVHMSTVHVGGSQVSPTTEV